MLEIEIDSEKNIAHFLQPVANCTSHSPLLREKPAILTPAQNLKQGLSDKTKMRNETLQKWRLTFFSTSPALSVVDRFSWTIFYLMPFLELESKERKHETITRHSFIGERDKNLNNRPYIGNHWQIDTRLTLPPCNIDTCHRRQAYSGTPSQNALPVNE